MQSTVWNKKDSINGVSAEEVIKAHNIKESEEIFLIKNGARTTELQFKDIIIANYKLDPNLTCEEVAQKYLSIKQQEEQKQQEEILSLQKQQEEINAIKKQNAELSYLIMQQGGAL